MADSHVWDRFDLSSDIAPVHEALQQTRILLVGSGGLGSELAIKLAGCRIGHLTLIDGDEVEHQNIPHSSIFLPSDVGQKKVDVVARFVAEKFPGCQVTPVPMFIQQKGEDIYSAHDFIICAPDSDQARQWVNYYAWKYKKRALFIGVSGPRNEWSGYTLLYTPGVSGCFLCFSSGGEEGEAVDYTVVPDTGNSDEARLRCGGVNVAVPMLAPVVGMIANYAASIVLKSIIGIPADPYTYINLKKTRLVTRVIKPVPTCAVCGTKEEYELPRRQELEA